jgi:hypothetical protein
MFFFEKKNQKTFANLASLHPGKPKPEQSKVFWFFFSKKNRFSSLKAEAAKYTRSPSDA